MTIDVRMPQPYELVGNLVDPLGVALAFVLLGSGGSAATIRISNGEGVGMLVRTLSAGGSGEFGGPYALTLELPLVPSTLDGTIEIFAGHHPSGPPLAVVPVQFGAVLTNQYMSYTLHEVVAGESLWSIAESEYEFGGGGPLWHRIYDVNRHQIVDPNVIHVGQLLMVPRSTDTEFQHA